MDRARCLLDEILGPNRNSLTKDEWKTSNHKDVCIYMLMGFCPYEHFDGVKLFIGKCPYPNHQSFYVQIYNKSGKPSYASYYKTLILELLKIYTKIQSKHLGKYENYKSFLHLNNNDYYDYCLLLARRNLNIKNINNFLTQKNHDSAADSYMKMKDIEYRIYRTYHKNIFVCNVCGKEFNGLQPLEYVHSHFKSKLHRAIDVFNNKLGSMLHGIYNEQLIYSEIKKWL